MYPNPYRARGLTRTLSGNTKGFFNGLTGQKNPENDTEMIQNYRRYRHTSGNGRKDAFKVHVAENYNNKKELGKLFNDLRQHFDTRIEDVKQLIIKRGQ